MARHKTMAGGDTVGSGGLFCFWKITHHKNILRCYRVQLTVQMEESVKIPPRDLKQALFPQKTPGCVWKQQEEMSTYK